MHKYNIKLPVGVSVQGHEAPSIGRITSLHYPQIAQKPLWRDLQAALNHSVFVTSDGQYMVVADKMRVQFSNKLTIFALSLN